MIKREIFLCKFTIFVCLNNIHDNTLKSLEQTNNYALSLSLSLTIRFGLDDERDSAFVEMPPNMTSALIDPLPRVVEHIVLHTSFCIDRSGHQNLSIYVPLSLSSLFYIQNICCFCIRRRTKLVFYFRMSFSSIFCCSIYLRQRRQRLAKWIQWLLMSQNYLKKKVCRVSLKRRNYVLFSSYVRVCFFLG